MARLFSKDYHERSNSWFFNHVVIALSEGELEHWQSLDADGRYHLRFFPVEEKRQYFPARLDVVYDPATQSVVEHDCPECGHDENCRHYLSVLRYSYHFLKTDIFDIPVVETCDKHDLRADENWAEVLSRAKFLVEGIYAQDTDKVRFYHHLFHPINVPLLARIALSESPGDVPPATIDVYKRNLGAFSDALLRLLLFLHTQRAAYSQKGRFYSIYKKDFPAALALMRQAPGFFVVRETAEELQFPPTPYPLSLRVEPSGKKHFRAHPVIVDELSAFYPGYPTWLLLRNEVRYAYLPFRDELITQLMNGGVPLTERDLVYYRVLVNQALRRNDIYLDFDESIALPHIVSGEPRVALNLRGSGNEVLLEGSLHYPDGIRVPLSVARFNSPLVYCDFRDGDEGGKAWFHLPPEVFIQAKRLMDKLPRADKARLEQYSQLSFSGDEALAGLRDAIFELSEMDWDIDIEPQLNRLFVMKVPLKVEIAARRSEEIEWFTYDISYRYKDYTFSHEELRDFFRSSQEFMHTKDGRVFFFSNREVFEEVEKLARQSEKMADSVYRARVMNLPYYQRLMQDNPAFRIMGDQWLQKMSEDLSRRHMEAVDPLPAYLNTVLRGYQKAGVAWIRMLQHHRLNGILADEMGLGKTIQALSVILESPQGRTSLVICPKTLLYNWAAEIEKFHTNIPYQIVEGGKQDRADMLRNPNVKLLIMSYSIVLNDIELLKDIHFDWVVLDEAQSIKNVSAQRTSAIKKLHCDHRLALSGTPVENNLTELWSIYDFLMPGYLGTLVRFKKEYLDPENADSAAASLQRRVAPFLLRRIKKEVLLELPDKQEQVSWCKLYPLQEKIYLQILEAVRRQLFPSDASEPLNYIHVLAALTKLRQVCNHPHLANPDVLPDPASSAKLEQLLELVKDSLESGHKVLVFSQFVQMLKIIRTAIEELNVPYSYLDGQTRERMRVVREFEEDPSRRLFLISLKTGGTGLNLSSADTVILYDPWWNPMVENQAIDRAHRIGQTRKVQVFRLITKGTVEEKIVALQQSKLAMFESVISEGRQVLDALGPEELRSLFVYQ